MTADVTPLKGRRKPPTDVAVTAGDRLAAEIHRALPPAPAGMVAEWSEVELELIDIARRQANDIEGLEALLAADGLTVAGSTGQKRLHPAIAELRLSRVALARTLAQLRLPDQGPMKNVTKSRAAQTRWARERERNGQV